ncbi:MAG: DinB family protein, partial [Gemmatimonadetes bacterium]|nr:DinB family protein [Gemmatimonadota bacterium]
MKLHTLLALALVGAPAAGLAQEMPMAQGAAGSVASARQLHEMAKGWLIRSAEQMPEANYPFQPTPEVRTFGQLIGHVANANYFFCSPVKGETNPSTGDFEKTTSKAAL